MSTITPIESVVQAPDLGWIPSPESLYRLSIEQYEAMVASGVFTKRDRFHLINGFLVAKMTEYPPHAAACDATRLIVESLLPSGWYVRPDKPLRIPNYASVPEPDLVIARGTCLGLPGPASGAGECRVGRRGRQFEPLEDRAHGRNLWQGGCSGLLDHQPDRSSGRGLHDPGPGGYGACQIFKIGQEVPVIIDGVDAAGSP